MRFKNKYVIIRQWYDTKNITTDIIESNNTNNAYLCATKKKVDDAIYEVNKDFGIVNIIKL